MKNDRYLIENVSFSFRTGVGQKKYAASSPSGRMIGAFGATGANTDEALPLPQVSAELNAIVELAPDALIYKDDDFTAPNMTHALDEGISTMHIASHFHLVPAASHLSSLQLGDGTRLTLADLRNARFDFSKIDLLVLSCCDTATVDDGLNGTESLAGLAHLKGAGDVIATMWPVADQGAAVLMRGFYESMLASDDKGNAANFLAIAQRRLIRAGMDLDLRPANDRSGFGKEIRPAALNHPFFWAGFAAFTPGG